MDKLMERKNQFDLLTEDPNNYLIKYHHLLDDPGGMKYETIDGPYWYYSERYKEWLLVELGDKFDGASGTVDIHSNSWFFHDIVCNDACWFSGKKVSNWMASHVICDILNREAVYYRKHKKWKLYIKRKLEAPFWGLFTFLFGGQKIKRENGWFFIGDK